MQLESTNARIPPKLHFVFLSEDNQIIPGMPIFEQTTNDFINDAWVTIEITRQRVRIVDAQNWDKQKFKDVKFQNIARMGQIHLYDTLAGTEIEGQVPGFFDKTTNTWTINYPYRKDVVEITRQPDGTVTVTNAMGTVYVIIHDFITGKIDIYKRSPGTLGAEHLNAFATLKDIQNNDGGNRSEYGDDDASFSNLDLSVKRKIAEKLMEGGSGTIRYCQTDRGTRKACQLLPIQDKIDLCFQRQHGLERQCDKIPAFTKADFDRLIPKEIEVREDDELLFNHDYYPRNYKLPTEGFSQALYKARWINTICAIARVQMFLEYPDLMPPLPIYVDHELIQEAISVFNYADTKGDNDDYRYWSGLSIFAVSFTFSDSHGYGFKLIIGQFYSGHSTDEIKIKLWNTEAKLLRLEQTQRVHQVLQELQADPIVSRYRHPHDQRVSNEGNINFLHLKGITAIAPPNVFGISRIVKIFLNNGFGYSIKSELGAEDSEGTIIEIV